MPDQERRRPSRDLYPELRFYARVLTLTARVLVLVGALWVAVVLLGDGYPLDRVVKAIPLVTGTAFAYLMMRAGTQAIYLLFDVARNMKAIREEMQKPGGTPT